MRDKYLEGMSKVMIDAVNTEEYAQATGALAQQLSDLVRAVPRSTGQSHVDGAGAILAALATASHWRWRSASPILK